MKRIPAIFACLLFATLSIFSVSCSDACDDLEDICKGCKSTAKSDCKSSLSACDSVKGPAGKDCCEAIVDEWDELCD